MDLQVLFKSPITSVLDKKYFLEKRIGDEFVVSILKDKYALDFLYMKAIMSFVYVYMPSFIGAFKRLIQ